MSKTPTGSYDIDCHSAAQASHNFGPRGSGAGTLRAPDVLGDSERLIAFMGRIAATALSLLSLYTLLLSVLPELRAAPAAHFAISPFIIAMFAAVMGPATLSGGFPRSLFGLQTTNWKNALAFSVLASLAFIAAGAVLKLILIHTTWTFASLSLFRAAGVYQAVMLPCWLQAGLYLALAPLQEFVARCCLQAPLYALLNGTAFWRHFWSILISNLVFAAAHAHISFAFTVAVFIPGLFWGWLFARTNSLIAVGASHFMIGGTGIFLFGIEEMVAKLTG